MFFEISSSAPGGAKKNNENLKFDSLGKSRYAALRCNFVVAAPKGPHSLVFSCLASGAFYEIIGHLTFYEIIKIIIGKKFYYYIKNEKAYY